MHTWFISYACLLLERICFPGFVYMKHLKISAYGLAASLLVVFATLLRIVLVGLGWPLTNSDEGTIGLMAMHIAYNGEHPTFYYGQNYMGALQAYLGAAMFRLFGVSLFSLRLGLILFLLAPFFLCMYLLTSQLYTKGLALFTLFLFSIGSSFILARELTAIGGYPETLLFGALTFLLATYLALSADHKRSWRALGGRFALYALWGLAAGLGLWNDLLIIPFVLTSGLLILIFCWRELLRVGASISILLGLIIGMFPLISYNLRATWGVNDSWTTLRSLQSGGKAPLAHTTEVIIQQLRGTIQISLPQMTGNPFCPVTELPFLGPTSDPSRACTLTGLGWGISYLLLLALAIALALWALWQQRKQLFARELATELKQAKVRSVARLLLLANAPLSLYPFIFSLASIEWPGIHARYLIGLLIVTPAILWPLWKVASQLTSERKTYIKALALAGGGILALVVLFFLIGMGTLFGEVPMAQQENRLHTGMVDQLMRARITSIYTEYWTCNNTAFLSQERVVCVILGPNLEVDPAPYHNRVASYRARVQADPNAAYVFPNGHKYIAAFEQRTRQRKLRYHRWMIPGFVIFQPVSADPKRTERQGYWGPIGTDWPPLAPPFFHQRVDC